MFLNSRLSDKDEQLWVWEYQVDDSIHDMYMDVDEDIRFRIIDDTFVDVIPKSEPPSTAPRTPNPSLHQPHSMEEEKESKDQQHLAPFSITVSIYLHASCPVLNTCCMCPDCLNIPFSGHD